MPERTLPADHQCTVVEFIGIRGHWRCACGRAWWGTARYSEWDDRPLHIDGTEIAGGVVGSDREPAPNATRRATPPARIDGDDAS